MCESTRQRVLAVVTDVLWAALIPLASLALYLPNGAAMPYRWCVGALAAIAVGRAIHDRRMPAPRTLRAVGIMTACFAVFGTLGVLRYRGMTSSLHILDATLLCLLMLAAAQLSDRRRTLVVILGSWLATSACLGVVGAWEIVTAKHLPRNRPAQEFAGKVPGWNEIASFFDNPNLYAHFCGVVLLLVPVAWYTLGRGRRWAALPLGLALGVLLVNTGGRLALAGTFLSLLVWAFRSFAGRLISVLLAAGYGLALLVGIPAARAIQYQAWYAWAEFGDPGASSWVRLQLARTGWWMLQQTNYLGGGPGGFATWSLLPTNPYRFEQLNNAHSALVELTSEYGVVMGGSIVIVLVAAAIWGIRVSARRELEPLARAAGAALAAQAVGFILLTASHSTWQRQPVAAIHVALMITLAAFTEACTTVRSTRPHQGQPKDPTR